MALDPALLPFINHLDLIAFSQSRAGTATRQTIAGLADPHVSVASANITVPDTDSYIFAVYALADTATSGNMNAITLTAPSMLMDLDLPKFEVTGTTAAEPTSPLQLNDWRYNPYPLRPGEILQALSANSGTNTERATALIFLCDGAINPIPRNWKIEHVRATGATTQVAYTWNNGALTLRQNLREGYWAVVGMTAQGASLIAARLVFGNQGARPGCIGQDTDNEGSESYSYFRDGNLGVWGVFTRSQIPTVDSLAVTTDSAQIYFLDLVNLSDMGVLPFPVG